VGETVDLEPETEGWRSCVEDVAFRGDGVAAYGWIKRIKLRDPKQRRILKREIIGAQGVTTRRNADRKNTRARIQRMKEAGSSGRAE